MCSRNDYIALWTNGAADMTQHYLIGQGAGRKYYCTYYTTGSTPDLARQAKKKSLAGMQDFCNLREAAILPVWSIRIVYDRMNGRALNL